MSRSSSRRSEQVRLLQAQAAKRERNRRLTVAGVAVAVVVGVVATLVIAKLVTGGASSNDATPTQPGVPEVISAVTNVPSAALDSVGAGTVSTVPKPISGAAPLTEGGKPKVLYVGAEYCPYCAATRWGVVAALARFGTFTNLGQTSSSSSDVYPDTASLSFHGASYTSPYLVFSGYETQDRAGNPLDPPTATDEATFTTYDSPPYVPQNVAGSIPFIDIAGQYFSYGSSFDPGVLKGMSHQEIANALADPSSPVAQAIDGEANLVTAAICKVTGQQPAKVCSAAGVQTAAAKLGSGG